VTRDLHLTTHNTTDAMPPVEFEPKISAGERPQNYALDRAANGTGTPWILDIFIFLYCHVEVLVEGGGG